MVMTTPEFNSERKIYTFNINCPDCKHSQAVKISPVNSDNGSFYTIEKDDKIL
jgi:hypothetical protein